MSKSKFRPLHDRVVVKRVDAEEKSKGGIIIPDPPRKNPRKVKSPRSVQAAAMNPAS